MSQNEDTNQPHMIGLAVAAAQLGIPYQDAHRLLLTGRLRGEKRRGRWLVIAADVVAQRDRILNDRAQPVERGGD